jgi:hypothetical protein
MRRVNAPNRAADSFQAEVAHVCFEERVVDVFDL